MNYLRFLPEPSDPSMKVSGIQLLQIVERVLNYLEPAERAESAAAAREAQQAAEAAQEAERAAQAAAAAAAQAAEREQMMKEIQAQLTEQAVANTTVRLVDDGVAISMSDIQFSGDSAVLVEAERIKIMKIAVMLQRYPGRPILVGGHTAMAGTAKGRQEISTDRAQSVADFLVYLGCRTEAEITVRGYGADRPVADNATAAGQALNRRVEITLLDRE
jgi:outer membrane protein OmpA-like peptidoglycan-associated protein